MSEKILHLGVCEKFIPPFVELVREHLCFDDHLFLFLRAASGNGEMACRDNVRIYPQTMRGKLAYYLKAAIQMHKAEKIILHGLFDIRLVVLLFLMPWLLPKAFWAIWGGDLYARQTETRDWKWWLKECFRARVIRRLGYVISDNAGDIRNLRSWYASEAENLSLVFYTSNVFVGEPPGPSDTTDGVTVIIGNSATPTNRHIESLDKLYNSEARETTQPRIRRVIVPLSYGDPVYGKDVAEYGKKLFGDRFEPIFDFLPYSTYLELLKQVDIAVFNNSRQQGFGNLVQLLGMGKKVYISPETSLWEHFESLGLTVYDFSNYESSVIDSDVADNNHRIVEQQYSLEKIVNDARQVFERSR